ncbi:MAG: hypothetical protein ACOC7P_01795 [Chloroflexota bacterium]
MIIGLLAFMVFLAFLLAFWEIQIEGKDGWAAKLPAWRIEKGWLVKLAGGRVLLQLGLSTVSQLWYASGHEQGKGRHFSIFGAYHYLSDKYSDRGGGLGGY